MQKVFLWSSVTYECTHVTPSSALVPTTDMHACAPASVSGISRPSGNERSTMNRAMCASLRVMRSRLWVTGQAPHRGKGSAGAQFRCSILWNGALRAPRGEPGCDLHARVEAELVEDVRHMVVDR